MDRRRTLGRILIWLGVLAWVPYAWLKYLRQADPALLPFLALHLAGVIPGVVLTRWRWQGRSRPAAGSGSANRAPDGPDRQEAR
jgi:hypothetical protein